MRQLKMHLVIIIAILTNWHGLFAQSVSNDAWQYELEYTYIFNVQGNTTGATKDIFRNSNNSENGFGIGVNFTKNKVTELLNVFGGFAYQSTHVKSTQRYTDSLILDGTYKYGGPYVGVSLTRGSDNFGFYGSLAYGFVALVLDERFSYNSHGSIGQEFSYALRQTIAFGVGTYLHFGKITLIPKYQLKILFPRNAGTIPTLSTQGVSLTFGIIF